MTTPDATPSDLTELTTSFSAVGDELRVVEQARRILAVRLLNEGVTEEEVMLKAGVSWRVLAAWCYAKDGTPLIPEEVIAAIEREVEQASQRQSATANRRRAKRGEALTDDDRRYKHLLEEIEVLKSEYLAGEGVPWTYGEWDELDRKVDLANHWY